MKLEIRRSLIYYINVIFVSLLSMLAVMLVMMGSSFGGEVGVEAGFEGETKIDSSCPRVLASSPSVAMVASIVAGDDFIIDMINIGDSCPHHYAGKLSDRKKLQDADAVIYIDDSFESFFAAMIRNFSGQKYRISSNSNLSQWQIKGQVNGQINERSKGQINDSQQNNINWHFWNNLHLTAAIIEDVGDFLISIKPTSKAKILARVDAAKKRLVQLDYEVQEAVAQVVSKSGPVMLMSKSIEPLFYNVEYRSMFPGDYPGLKFIERLEQLLEIQPDICAISDVHDRYDNIVSKYKIRHVSLDAENINFISNAEPVQTQYQGENQNKEGQNKEGQNKEGQNKEGQHKDPMQQYIVYIHGILKSIEECHK